MGKKHLKLWMKYHYRSFPNAVVGLIYEWVTLAEVEKALEKNRSKICITDQTEAQRKTSRLRQMKLSNFEEVWENE